MRLLTKLVLTAAGVALAACSGDNGITSPSADALQAADRLSRLADSISVSDTESAAIVRGLADVVRRSGAGSAVRITLDGETGDFTAVSDESILTSRCTTPASSGGQSVARCLPVPLRSRSFVAWEPSARRMVVLTALAESGVIGGDFDATRVAMPARLQLFDGRDGVWWGVAGSQRNAMTLGKECRSSALRAGDKLVTMTCHQADFRWSFEAIAGVPAISIPGNSASGQHTVTMAESSVHGTHWNVVVTTASPVARAPASPLLAGLRVSVDSVVRLSLMVRNSGDAKVDLKFGSGKTHDFAVMDRDGNTLWRWSDGREFADSVTVLSIAAHESVTFTELWRPTAHGALIAAATLTSATQNVSTRAAFTVP